MLQYCLKQIKKTHKKIFIFRFIYLKKSWANWKIYEPTHNRFLSHQLEAKREFVSRRLSFKAPIEFCCYAVKSYDNNSRCYDFESLKLNEHLKSQHGCSLPTLYLRQEKLEAFLAVMEEAGMTYKKMD